MSPDIDIEKLFEEHTVDEVKQKLNRIRNEIERKKEDLRVMVGERYRDLIEAADTIECMEQSAAGVCDEVATVQKLCSSLQHRGLIGFKTSPRKSIKHPFTANSEASFAAEVKVIVMCSTRVWSLLEKSQILHATLVYLLAHHTHVALTLSQQTTNIDVSLKFPVVARQWASVCQLPSTITRVCQYVITASTQSGQLNVQRVCEAVVSLVLLQDSTLNASLDRVLQLLHSSLLQTLTKYTPQQTARPIVTAFCNRLIQSLTLLHGVFACDSDGHSAVEKCLLQVLGTESDSNVIMPINLLEESESYLNLLPHTIHEYRPYIKGSFLEKQELAHRVKTWLNDIECVAKNHLNTILGYCPSIQSMCSVRSSVWKLLDETIPPNWSQIKGSLGLSNDWCIWQSVVRDCIQQRASELITRQLDATVQHVLQDITQLTNDISEGGRVTGEEGSGIVKYVWSEAPGDLPDKVGWLSAAQRTLHQAGGLAYKSSGYTPRTQAICNSFNSLLLSLQQDLEHMYSAETEVEVRTGAKQDYEALLALLQEEACSQFISLIESTRKLAENVPSNYVDSLDSNATIERSFPWHLAEQEFALSSGGEAGAENDLPLLKPLQTVLVSLARICHALAHICPNMQLCAIATALINPDTVRRVSLGLPVECSNLGNSKSWTTVQRELEAANTALLQHFLDTLTHALSATVTTQLLTSLEEERSLYVFFNLSLCEIVEEEGSSKLSIPCQLTPALGSALHTLCRSLNTTTIHTLNRSFAGSISGQVCLSIINAYSKIVPAVIKSNNKVLALHLLFDLKFVAATMLPSDAAHKNTSTSLYSLQQQLESIIDPFDLTVLQSHLATRVRAAANRSQVILGAVYVKDRQHPTVKGVAQSGVTVLPLVPVMDVPRFSNVPLPKTVTASSALATFVNEEREASGPTLVLEKTSTSTVTTKSHLSPSSSSGITPSTRTASSIFSAMSSSWFGASNTK